MHPINASEIRATTMRRCAVVKAETRGVGSRATLTLLGDGVFVAENIEMLKIPDRIKVLSPDGEEISPSEGRAFWMSASTSDPFHLVTEWPSW